MAKTKEKTVEVMVDLGDLKPLVQKTAKRWGISPEEFVRDAIESAVAQHTVHDGDNYARHGGKHRQGKQTGYEVTADGKYYPAPLWTRQFEQLFAERSAIYNLVNAVVAQAQERLIEVEKNIHQTKARLVDDLKLDPARDWVYYGGGGDGYLTEQKAADNEEGKD